MATTCAFCCRAWTKARFWFGVTRPKTVVTSTAAASSVGSSGRLRASTGVPTSGTPTRSATAPTVLGLSPEITFSPTPCDWKYRIVSSASGRTCSSKVRTATAARPGGSVSPSSGASPWATSSTRWPESESASTRERTAGSGGQAPRTISGAPITQVPWPSKVAPLHLRADEKATDAVRTHASDGVNAAARAARVAFGWGSSARAAMAPAARSSSIPSTHSIAAKRIAPSVRVPVLSRQTTSTRASPSTAGSSCTSTLRRARLSAPTKKAMLVSSTRPSGTIPTRAATVPTTASEVPSLPRVSWLTRRIGPMMTRPQLMYRSRVSMPSISSERVFVKRFVSAASRWA